MSSETSTDTSESTDSEETRGRIETLETYVSPGAPIVTDRLSIVRTRWTEYEAAESDEERQEVLDKIESELEQIRDAIEEEVDEGRAKAHDLLDRIEKKVSSLR